jgi:hypothetical protein
MEKRFEYRGDLAVTPLAEILATIHRYRVPGVVRAARGDRERAIYLESGLVVFATATERDAGLGAYLERERIVTPEIARQAGEEVREGLRLGQILLAMGVLTEEALRDAVSGQIREILWGAFEWDAGAVSFDIGPRRSGEDIRIDLSIPEVIVEGVRRATDVRRLVRRIGQATTLLERTPGELLALFAPAERRYYDAVDGKTPLQPLCGKGPGSAVDNARLLYAFFCLGLLQRRTGAPGTKIRYKAAR